MIFIAALVLAADVWSLVLLVIFVVVAVFVVHTAPSRTVDALLGSDALFINGQSFPLKDYRSFRLSADDDIAVVLAPHRHFRLPVVLPLPAGATTAHQVLDHLGQRLICDAAPSSHDRKPGVPSASDAMARDCAKCKAGPFLRRRARQGMSVSTDPAKCCPRCGQKALWPCQHPLAGSRRPAAGNRRAPENDRRPPRASVFPDNRLMILRWSCALRAPHPDSGKRQKP